MLSVPTWSWISLNCSDRRRSETGVHKSLNVNAFQGSIVRAYIDRIGCVCLMCIYHDLLALCMKKTWFQDKAVHAARKNTFRWSSSTFDNASQTRFGDRDVVTCF
jgi:hypothetical protein